MATALAVSIGGVAIVGNSLTVSATSSTTSPVVGGYLLAGNVNNGSVTQYKSMPIGIGSTAPTGQLSSIGTTYRTNSFSFMVSAEATDPNGDVWVAGEDNASTLSNPYIIEKLTPLELALGEGPSATIESVALNCNSSCNSAYSLTSPSGIAFDSQGNMWVTNSKYNIVDEYSASQLASLTSTADALMPTQYLVLSDQLNSYNPLGIAIHKLTAPNANAADDYAFLTVANFSGAQSAVVGVDLSTLTGTGGAQSAYSPAMEIYGSNTGLNTPVSPAIDSNGNLWVANSASNTSDYTISEFSSNQIGSAFTAQTTSSSTNYTPYLTLSSSTDANGNVSIYQPSAIALDAAGNLYVANGYDSSTNTAAGSVAEFGASQLVSSSAPGATITPSPINLDSNSLLNVPTSATFLNVNGSTKLALGSSSTINVLNLPLNHSSVFNQPGSLAIDSHGDVWIADYANSTIEMYTQSEIASNLPPSVTLSSATVPYGTNNNSSYQSLNGPTGVAIDANGNLWVTNFSDSDVVEFSASSITTSSSPVPIANYSTVPTNIGGASKNPTLYDPSTTIITSIGGKPYLWIDNSFKSSRESPSIVAFDLSNMTGKGVQMIPSPSIEISGTSTGLNLSVGFAFDSNGDLWASNKDSNTIVEYTKSQLSSALNMGPDNIVPHLTLNGNTNNPANIFQPNQITFDAAGNLYVANYAGTPTSMGSITEFSAAQLSGLSGTQTLTPVSINYGDASLLSSPQGLIFVPTSTTTGTG
ncbi:MAG: hypothetical protein M0019_03570, partial [Actinomycetota bacterium]|nr:hypothetical protein [Actinomycetota bacterium]